MKRKPEQVHYEIWEDDDGVRRLPPIRLDPDLENLAVEIIAPVKQEEALCRSALALAVFHGQTLVTFRVDKRKLKSLKNALQKAIRLLEELPRLLSCCVISDISGEIAKTVKGQLYAIESTSAFSDYEIVHAQLVNAVRNIEHELSMPKGMDKVDMCKLETAGSAYGLLRRFSSKAPTTTADGPYYRLSSILYEGVTGTADAGLERSCREILKDPSGWD